MKKNNKSSLVFMYYLLILSLLSWQCGSSSTKIQTSHLLEGFQSPPTDAKPKGYWCLVNGNFDLTQMTKELKEYQDKGVGTLDLWDVAGWVDPNAVIPAGPAFMSELSVQAIAHAIREAGKIGMDIGLTISSSWNAGGDWVKAEDGVMGLFESSTTLKGPAKVQQDLAFPDIPSKFRNSKMLLEKGADGLPTFYKEVAVLGYQQGPDSLIHQLVDLSSFFDGKQLTWEAPPGEWTIVRYVCTGTGQPLMRPSPNSNGLMIDHFNPAAMERHLNFFFEKLEAELGDLSQTALKYLYTDSYEANSAVWTIKMPEEFKRRKGYDIYPYLPILQGYTVDHKETSERFLFDFKQVLSDLIIENHYVLGQKLCREKGLDFIAEAGGPGPPIHNVPFESLSSLGKLAAPRGEFWYDPTWTKAKTDPLQIVKGPASAAHLYNQARVEAEAFTGTQIWQNGPGDLKPTADRALCEGLTSFVYHTSPHIPREAGQPGWVYNFGTIINTTRAWWAKSKAFHHYLGRSCFLLQQGNFVADVLYYYGDQAPNFVAPKHIDPALGFGYDYDVCNSDIILNHLQVKKGYFQLAHGQRYKTLVLPDSEQMNPEVLEKLAQLVKAGGVIIGPAPNRAHSLSDANKNDQRIKELAQKLWSNDTKSSFGKGWVYSDKSQLRNILEKDLFIPPDVKVVGSSKEAALDFIHRETTNEDIYFFRNTSAEKQYFQVQLRSAKGAPSWWDPDQETLSAVSIYQQQNGLTTLPFNLDGFGSVFIILSAEAPKTSISMIKRGEEILFPSDNASFPIWYTPAGLRFEEAGQYTLQSTDGHTEKLAVNPPEIKSINGPWEIRFPHGWGAPQRATFDSLISWTTAPQQGIKHFSGTGVYHKTFEWRPENSAKNHQIILDLGAVSKVAEVYLNGKHLGIRWFAPFAFDITESLKPGTNYLTVEVANVMSNQMTGDASREGIEKRTHSNITKGPNAWSTPYRELRLVKSGLLGPVTVTSFFRK